MIKLYDQNSMLLAGVLALLLLAGSVSYYLLVAVPRAQVAQQVHQNELDAVKQQKARDAARKECIAKQAEPGATSAGRLTTAQQCNQYLK